MSLSTQLARGSLAIPMLALFAALGVAADKPAEVESGEVAQALAELCPTARTQVLVLAQAPADLGALAVRWKQPCHG